MDTDEIVRLLKLRDEKALVYLYDNYAAALNGIIFRILKSNKLSEEVLQQTFLKIWNKIELYDSSKAQLFTWMHRIAKNTALDAKRLKRYENNQNTASLDLEIHNVQNNHISLANMDVQPLISLLDEKYRILLDHIYLNGYTQSETSEKLGIPIGTVKTRVRKAIMTLRVELKNEKKLFISSCLILFFLTPALCL